MINPGALPGMIHAFTLKRMVTSTLATTGRVTSTYSDVPVRGRIAMRNFDTADVAAQEGVQYDAVAIAPNGLVIKRVDRILVPPLAGLPGLDGLYEIAAVRQVYLHQRVLIRRFEP